MDKRRASDSKPAIVGRWSIDGIRAAERKELELLARPSGYFRQKAKPLKEFIASIDKRYGGSLAAMLATPTLELREELLAQRGISPDTADSIVLHAGHPPIFVVAAYTRRVPERYDAIHPKATYDEIRGIVEDALSAADRVIDDSVVLDPGRPAVHEAVSDELGGQMVIGANVQRDAWFVCATGEALLLEAESQV